MIFSKCEPCVFCSSLLSLRAPDRALIAAEVPDVPAERRAIRKIVRLGGDVGRRDDGHVTSVSFKHGNDFGDEDIPVLTPFTQLEMLNLQGTQIAGTRISGSGFNELNGLKNLRRLSLRNTGVGDGGIERLTGLNLWELDLIATQITDASLRVIGQFKHLSSLRLRNTKVTGPGLKELTGLKSLWDLELNNTKITDTGLKGTQELQSLKSLDLSGTQVTGTA